MTKNSKQTTSQKPESRKLFSLSSGGKTKPVKAGKKILGAVSRVEEDGSVVVGDNFDNSPESIDEALASSNVFGNIDKYISDIRKIAGLNISIEDAIKMQTTDKKEKK